MCLMPRRHRHPAGCSIHPRYPLVTMKPLNTTTTPEVGTDATPQETTHTRVLAMFYESQRAAAAEQCDALQDVPPEERNRYLAMFDEAKRAAPAVIVIPPVEADTLAIPRDTGWLWRSGGRCIREAERVVRFHEGTPDWIIVAMMYTIRSQMDGQIQQVRREGLTITAYQCIDSSD